ncbi:hypothetical protein Mesop_3641 [Mesorhizobium opportunistum WSM2075]|uniref:Uncharacterized protein n=1 Tax=Mesorhizobium opportunistum (strain LMG 24607 / HAMBI 3007 / WSM2075) TaxID=536019 RepID=F7YH61_MESOW|nr:hypothetical protein Mesop_3641 [Mesorhizobium opportunistum WSM2075]
MPAFPATLAIGEAGDDSVLLPVIIRGEDAGRQVRGSADGLFLSKPTARLVYVCSLYVLDGA